MEARCTSLMEIYTVSLVFTHTNTHSVFRDEDVHLCCVSVCFVCGCVCECMSASMSLSLETDVWAKSGPCTICKVLLGVGSWCQVIRRKREKEREREREREKQLDIWSELSAVEFLAWSFWLHRPVVVISCNLSLSRHSHPYITGLPVSPGQGKASDPTLYKLADFCSPLSDSGREEALSLSLSLSAQTVLLLCLDTQQKGCSFNPYHYTSCTWLFAPDTHPLIREAREQTGQRTFSLSLSLSLLLSLTFHPSFLLLADRMTRTEPKFGDSCSLLTCLLACVCCVLCAVCAVWKIRPRGKNQAVVTMVTSLKACRPKALRVDWCNFSYPCVTRRGLPHFDFLSLVQREKEKEKERERESSNTPPTFVSSLPSQVDPVKECLSLFLLPFSLSYFLLLTSDFCICQ